MVEAVRRAVDDRTGRIAVTAKLNMADGVRGGISIEESLQTAKWLQDDGCLDAIELTAGSSLVNPMYLFRGDAPVKQFADASPPLGGHPDDGQEVLPRIPLPRRVSAAATPGCSAPS